MVRFEAKHFPLVLLDLGGSGRTPDELRGVFVGFHDVHRRARTEGTRWILVAATDSPPDAVERKIITEEANKFSRQDVAVCVASVLVISNGIIRSVVTAIGWMTPHMPSLAAAPTTSIAVDLAVERLRAVGVACKEGGADQAKRWFARDELVAKPCVAGDGKGAR